MFLKTYAFRYVRMLIISSILSRIRSLVLVSFPSRVLVSPCVGPVCVKCNWTASRFDFLYSLCFANEQSTFNLSIFRECVPHYISLSHILSISPFAFLTLVSISIVRASVKSLRISSLSLRSCCSSPASFHDLCRVVRSGLSFGR